MASVEASACSPPPQAPPPPPPRPITAALALGIAATVFSVLVFLSFDVSLWLCSAANGAYVAALWAYGERSPTTVAAKEIAIFTSLLMGLLFHAVALIFLSFCWHHGSNSEVQARDREIGGHGGAEKPQLPDGAEGRHVELPSALVPVVFLIVVLFFVILVGVLMGLREMLYFVFLLNSLIFCFFTSRAVIIANGQHRKWSNGLVTLVL